MRASMSERVPTLGMGAKMLREECTTYFDAQIGLHLRAMARPRRARGAQQQPRDFALPVSLQRNMADLGATKVSFHRLGEAMPLDLLGGLACHSGSPPAACVAGIRRLRHRGREPTRNAPAR